MVCAVSEQATEAQAFASANRGQLSLVLSKKVRLPRAGQALQVLPPTLSGCIHPASLPQ